MSRKGNDLNNAPIGSRSNLMKREFLNHKKTSPDLNELKQNVSRYIHWLNHQRISAIRKGLTPIEYRNQAFSV